MLRITLYTSRPPQQLVAQVIGIATEYLTEISLGGTPPSNGLYPMHQAALGIEIALYIQAMGQVADRRVELIVASDDENPGQVLGFLMYLPLKDSQEACGVTYMAVLQSHRRRGIAHAMVRAMLHRYPHAELSCFVEKVSLYETLGFQVIGLRETQVRMCTRDKSPDGVMAVIDTGPIFQMEPVRVLQLRQQQKLGQRGFKDAEKQFQRHVERLRQKARAFAQERLGDEVQL